MTGSQVLVAGRYQLVSSLGYGGMGRVWLARDEVLDRNVAIKEVVLPFGLADAEREELVVRTLREARMAARLNHPNVVRIYDVVRTDEQPWIVMEYVRSRSLLQVIREEGPLPAVRVAEIGLAVLSALAASHRAGVLHRDVKPSNVLIADDDRVMLTDFGLATFEEGDNAVTRPGLILGSPHYIAPERAREGVATAKSDLWSLGATLYAAVEGRSPYARATTIATLTALATERPDPVVHAGPLKPVLDGLLRRNPRTRFDVADAERLLRRVAGTGAGKRSSSPIPRRSPRPRTLADLNPGVQRDGDGSPALFGQPGGTGRNGRPIGTAQPTGNGRPTVTTGQAGNGHPTGNGHRADAGRSVPAAPVGTARVRVPGPTGTAGSTTGGVPATAAQATGRV